MTNAESQTFRIGEGRASYKAMRDFLSMSWRAVLSCLCQENCRLCKKEISFSIILDYINDPDYSYVYVNSENSELLANSENAENSKALEVLKDLENAKETVIIYPNEAPKMIFKRLVIESLLESLREKLEWAENFLVTAVASPAVYPALLEMSDERDAPRFFSECLCEQCWFELETQTPLIGFCKLNSDMQGRLTIVSGAQYENSLRDLIGRFKYEGDKLLAVDLTFMMLNAWSLLKEHIPAQKLLIVPVPLHKQRQRNRGFNQAELLARKLSSVTGIACKKSLKRTFSTKPQQTLGRQERLRNVKGAFRANLKDVVNRNVILVDDVCTSGATLVECAEELLRSGAASVVAITVARALIFKSFRA